MCTELQIILIYMAMISIIGFIAMGTDKAKAKRNAWRVSEKTLLGLAVIGGGVGVWLGMEIFRHKTKHWYFKYGVPFITLLELAAVFYMLH